MTGHLLPNDTRSRRGLVHVLRRAARRVTIGALAGALLCAGAPGTVSAAPAPAPPPAGAVAAPASSASVSTGTGTNYWASDNCHYYQSGAEWRSDVCLLSITTGGNIVPGLFGWFQNLGDGHFGRELVRLDISNPDYLAFSFITTQYTLGTWFRVFYADPKRIEEAAATNDGRAIWISLPVQPSPQRSGPPEQSGNPAKDAQERELWRNYNNGQLLTGLLAAGATLG